eukprot:6048586-Pyramimonas_sp.AAC.1
MMASAMMTLSRSDPPLLAASDRRFPPMFPASGCSPADAPRRERCRGCPNRPERPPNPNYDPNARPRIVKQIVN